MTELIDIITESRKNIDKTKVCSRHKKQASPQFPIPLFFFAAFSLCDTTSHHRLITSIHKKTIRNVQIHVNVLCLASPTPPLLQEQFRVDVCMK